MLKTIFTVFCISIAIMMSVFVYACHDEKKATSKVLINTFVISIVTYILCIVTASGVLIYHLFLK